MISDMPRNMPRNMPRFEFYFLNELDRKGWFEVLVENETHDQREVSQWIADCLKGRWTLDWMHGDDRSATSRERSTIRYLFEDAEDATLARTFWG